MDERPRLKKGPVDLCGLIPFHVHRSLCPARRHPCRNGLDGAVFPSLATHWRQPCGRTAEARSSLEELSRWPVAQPGAHGYEDAAAHHGQGHVVDAEGWGRA